MTTPFELKNYQTEALDHFRRYLLRAQTLGARTAFIDQTNRPYTAAPELNEDVPYICLRIPTGGGKTIMAAHSVQIAADAWLNTDNPMVLWLAPSNVIRDQTLAALRNLDHPYRLALAERFGRNLSILSLSEALALSRADAEGGACIIVATLQSFRIEETEGRKVYEDSGALMDHFSGLDPSQLARLDRVEGTGRPVASLCNLLRLHRPYVIVDEAHNARSALSFRTLERLAPSLILELTATPETETKPDKNKVASNILYHVSAAELKAEEMVKLPIRLQTDPDWRKTVGQALDCIAMLDEAAKVEESRTGEYLRPILLFQAQSKSKTDPDRLTPDKVRQFLLEDKRIAAEQIAMHGAGHRDLDQIVDIEDPACPVRYIITVQALREGWDCPFAYVLCSVAELSSKTAVEQLLGRVLRMPKAKRKSHDALNRAYAFVASRDFQTVATNLKDGLVDGAGFNRLEVEELVKSHGDLGFAEERPGFTYEADAFDNDEDDIAVAVAEATEKLPPQLRERVTFDAKTRKLAVADPLSKEDRNAMHLAFGKVRSAERVIDALYRKSNRIQTSENPDGPKPVFNVPGLGIWRQGELQLFTADAFHPLPWPLAECDPTEFARSFQIRDGSKTGDIDVTDNGSITIDFAAALHEQLSMVIHEPAWSLPRLVNWIDRGIPHPDVTKPSAKVFIARAIEAIIKRHGYELDQLVRYKRELRRDLASEIDRLRKDREASQFQDFFGTDTADFATGAEIGVTFDEDRYAYNQPYRGGTKFTKHYFPIIGDLQADGEEHECACYLDRHNDVKFWVRNVDRKPNAFWLQLSTRKFYPDFVALLQDGRKMAVEYKGEHIFDTRESREKRLIGETWAEASKGECVFVMPTRRQFTEIDAAISSG